MTTNKMADEEDGFIRLKDVDSTFQKRSNFVFAELGNLEPKRNDSARVETSKKGNNRATDEKSVKVARLPKRVPDHVLSPEKWTKYSLKSDGSEQFRGLDEQSLNRHAALSFLAALKERKDEAKIPERSPKTGRKIRFKKPTVSAAQASELKKGVWKDGCYVMPEVAPGAPTSRKRPLGVHPPAGCASKVSLSHLGEEDVDQEEGEEVEESQSKKQKMQADKDNSESL